MAAAYTFCDYKHEENCQKILLEIEQSFRDFHDLLTAEVNSQREFADKLWIQIQRYLVLTQAVPCFKSYPKIISERMEGEILSEIHDNIQSIRKSNYKLQCAMHSIVHRIKEFDQSTKSLDYKTLSPFTQGNKYQKPIFYYIEMVHDIYSHFRRILSKLKFGSNVLTSSSVEAVETYKKLLEPSEDIDDFVKFCLCTCRNAKIN